MAGLALAVVTVDDKYWFLADTQPDPDQIKVTLATSFPLLSHGLFGCAAAAAAAAHAASAVRMDTMRKQGWAHFVIVQGFLVVMT